MSAMRVRLSLAAQLPDPAELAAPCTGSDAPAEELRLAPIATLRVSRSRAAESRPAESRPAESRPAESRPAEPRSAAIALPDARQLALLDATAARLAEIDHISRSLRPDVAAQLGEARGAIADLARELRAIVAERALLAGARIALRAG